MMDVVSSIDNALAVALPPLWRVCAWAFASAAFSMWIYAKISPQQKIKQLKAAQKESRRALLAHNGSFSEMNSLIRADLALSLRQAGLALFPFVVSLLPLLWLMMELMIRYNLPLVEFGPEWMRGFDFWYIAVLLIVSLAIKMMFNID